MEATEQGASASSLTLIKNELSGFSRVGSLWFVNLLYMCRLDTTTTAYIYLQHWAAAAAEK